MLPQQQEDCSLSLLKFPMLKFIVLRSVSFLSMAKKESNGL